MKYIRICIISLILHQPNQLRYLLTRKPLPNPSFLETCTVHAVKNGKKIWKSSDGARYYQWDGLHGEIEAYNKRGEHLGALEPLSGTKIKDAVRGRKIDVS